MQAVRETSQVLFSTSIQPCDDLGHWRQGSVGSCCTCKSTTDSSCRPQVHIWGHNLEGQKLLLAELLLVSLHSQSFQEGNSQKRRAMRPLPDSNSQPI